METTGNKKELLSVIHFFHAVPAFCTLENQKFGTGPDNKEKSIGLKMNFSGLC